MAESDNELVEGGIDTGAAYLLNMGLGLEWNRYGLIQLLLGLRDEGCEQDMQRILPHGLLLLLVMPRRVRVVVGMISPRLPTVHPLQLPLCGGLRRRLRCG